MRFDFFARRRRRSGPQIGDVIEIDTPRGRGYLQLTHRHRQEGDLVRGLPGTYEEQPPLAELVARDELFLTFFPLEAALRRGLVRVVGNEPVPRRNRSFPKFLTEGAIDASGTVRNWWLWDGRKERFLGEELPPEYADLPTRQIVNDAVLREWLSGVADERAERSERTPRRLHAYLHFDDRGRAEAAAAALREAGWETDLEAEDTVRVRASTPVDAASVDDRVRSAEAQLAALATRFHGEYDGFEVELG